MASAFTVSPSDINAFTHKNVLITGGSSGIGLATAALLLSPSSSSNAVVSLDRSSPPPDASASLHHIQCDVTSWPSQRAAFSTALTTHFPTPRLDAVFVNAGITEEGTPFFGEQLDGDGALAKPDLGTLDVNLGGAVDTLKLAIYHMRDDKRGQRGGSIVMTASMAAYLSFYGIHVYSASKHGIVGLLRSLKADCARVGIALSLVAPGLTLTSILTRRDLGEDLYVWEDRMKRAGVPMQSASDVARVVVWLMGLGKEAAGKGIMVQAARCVDVEAGLSRSKGAWMGRELMEVGRRARDVPLDRSSL